ncbi:MAG: APC family permease [Hyphomonadaceae bacterium]|nr:APC family permease [Hyphomonadaceae bacterium]
MRSIDPAQAAPARRIPTAAVVMLSIGMVVGAGIFKAPAQAADAAGSAYWLYAAWIAGGALSLVGALCYAELSTAFPHPGGDFHFLQRAYGRGVAFVFAWTRFTVINAGSAAFLGFVIGDYLNATPGLSLGPDGPAVYAAVSVLALTIYNLRGAWKSAGDYAVTGLEILGLAMLTCAALWLALRGVPPLTDMAGPDLAAPPASFGLSLVFVLLAFGGWSEMATLSAEVKDARRGMARALIISVLAITALYLMVNWAFLRGLGYAGLAGDDAPAATLMRAAFGPNTAWLIAIAVALAAITSINATLIVGARTTYAAARDYPALRALARWDPARGAPARATLAQGAISLALVGLGAWTRDGFATLVDYTAPAFWFFLTLSALAVIILRRKHPDIPRPFKTPLYPWLPLLFAAANAWVLISSLTYLASLPSVRIGAFVGIAVTGIGAALYLVLRRSGPAPD